jgi:dTDP-glucose 4,6-dehydratase
MTIKNKKILVTGAGGFIGSHLAEMLVVRGASVRALVHYNALGKFGWLDDSPYAKDMEIIAGDIMDGESVTQAMKGMDIVLHLAALIAIPYSYIAPRSYVRTNVEGTLNVLQAARESATVQRVVHTSTSEVYGTARYVPINEAHPLQGQSPYSASKIGADKMAESFYDSFNTPVVTLRPFNTFGPRQSARAVIPTIITQALAGKDIKLGSLSPTRDLTFVTDTAEGFIKAATTKGIEGETINLGVGAEITIGDLAAKILKIIGSKSKIISDEARIRPANSEVERLLSDNSRAKSLLKWQPQVSLDQGLAKAVEWFKGNHLSYKTDRYVV